jgi:hypothetical protein
MRDKQRFRKKSKAEAASAKASYLEVRLVLHYKAWHVRPTLPFPRCLARTQHHLLDRAPFCARFFYCLLVLVSQLYVAMFIATWLTFLSVKHNLGPCTCEKSLTRMRRIPILVPFGRHRCCYMVGIYFLIGIFRLDPYLSG